MFVHFLCVVIDLPHGDNQPAGDGPALPTCLYFPPAALVESEAERDCGVPPGSVHVADSRSGSFIVNLQAWNREGRDWKAFDLTDSPGPVLL